MPDATITSTASTFGTISGVFSSDQSTITGTITGVVAGTLDGSVGVPGPQGPAGSQGPQGEPGPGVPAGGLEGQILLKATDTSYDTVWADNYANAVKATVRNESGSTMTKGTVVYISGASGNKAVVSKASASTEAGSSKTFAILEEDIPTNQNGTAITMGLLKGVDTSAFTPGANLWLSVTPGQITQTPPASPNHAVFLGNAVRIHANQGEIEVRIANGYEIGELHDVLITSPTNGQVLKYDAATSLWKNGTDVGGVAWGGITGTLSAQTDLQTALDAKATAADYLSKAGNLSGLANLVTARANLGLGTMATETATNYLTKAGNLSGLTNTATARNNLYLGATDVVIHKGVQMAEGSATIGNAFTNAAAGAFDNNNPEFSFVTNHYINVGTEEDPIVGVSASVSYKVDRDGFRYYAYPFYTFAENPVPYTGKTLTYNGNDGRLSFGGIFEGTNEGQISIANTDITFPDATVQTTAFPGFAGYATESFVTSQGYITSSALTGYATEAWVTSQGYLTSAPVTSVAGKTGAVTLDVADVSGAAPLASPALTGNVTITSNSSSPALIITQDGTGDVVQFRDVTSDTTFTFIDQNGKVNTPASTTAGAGFRILQGAAPTSPVDGDMWVTTTGLFTRLNGATQQYANLTAAQTFNGTTTFNSPVTIWGAAVNLGGSALSSTSANLAYGATPSGGTKTVSIGTGSLAGSTTSITIGSSAGTSTTTLQGTTNGVTQPNGTNNTTLATTAFVLANAGSPAYATIPQALAGSSTTTALNPFNVNFAEISAFVYAPVPSSLTSVTSGGGSSSMNAYGGGINSSSANAGYVLRHGSPYQRSVNISSGIQWQKPQMFAIRLTPYFAFQSASIFRMTLGSSTATLNVLSARGIGISFGASAANTFNPVVLDVHNGTSLTSVTSSFTPTLTQGFDVVVYSDGTGNVTLYINDAQVATTSAGPSTAAGANLNILQLGIENTTTLTTGSNVAFGSLKTFIS